MEASVVRVPVADLVALKAKAVPSLVMMSTKENKVIVNKTLNGDKESPKSSLGVKITPKISKPKKNEQQG